MATKARRAKSRPTIPLGEIPANVLSCMRADDICAALRVSRRTFASMRARGAYPPPDVRLGPTMPRWFRKTHDDWMRAQGYPGDEEET